MPIQRRSAPTLDEVARQIKVFESRYEINTETFKLNDNRSSHVDEDDGMEWFYLIHQLNALTEAAVGRLYSTGYASGPLQNHENSTELLAA